MSEGVLPGLETRQGWMWLGIRTRVVLTWSAVLAIAFLVGSGFMIRNAWEERRILMERAAAASLATANAFEREAAGTGYLLKGLSRSPALMSGDLKGFYDQLLTTPKPEGAWFALWNLDRQLLNTLRPFGAPLPARTDFEGTPESREAALRRIRERGLSVSNRTRGVVAGRDVVAISLRLNGPDGEMNGYLTTVLPLARLSAIAGEGRLPAGWKTYLLDRNLVPVAASDARPGQTPRFPHEVAARLRMQAGSGSFFGRDGTADVLVAYHRLPAPEFTAVITVPLALVNAPVAEATFRIALVGAGLTLLGALAALLVRRQIEPVETLRTAVFATESKLQSAEAEIEHAQRLLQRVVETSPDVIYVFDVQGRRNVFLGGQVEEVLGYSPEEVRAMGDEVLAQLVHPDDLPRVMEHVARLVNLRDREVATVEYRMRDAAGHYRWLRTNETGFSRDSEGRVTRVIGVATETSAMKAAEARILDVNERLRSILASVSDCYFTLDHAYRITDINGAAEHWIGPDRGQVMDGCLWDLCAPTAECSRVIQEGMEQRRGIRREVESGLRPGRWLDLHVYPSAEGVSVFFSDITERRAVQAELDAISERLLRLQEEERQRIAEELHDSTAQHLVAIGLNMVRLRKFISAPEGSKLLEETADLSEDAANEVRAFTYLLHPPALENGGLSGTVRVFATGFARRTGLNVSASVPEQANTLPFDVQRSLLRIIQEALTNVFRHAEASRVTIDLRLDARTLKLRIMDDGRGLSAGVREAVSEGALLGVGLAGMRARLLQFGGSLRILSGTRGTMVVALLPADRHDLASPDRGSSRENSGFAPSAQALADR